MPSLPRRDDLYRPLEGDQPEECWLEVRRPDPRRKFIVADRGSPALLFFEISWETIQKKEGDVDGCYDRQDGKDGMVSHDNQQGLLLGRYGVEEEVGGGGMGTVVRGRDELLGRTVAIKLLRDEFASDPNTVERFGREARIAASLSHPGIAPVYDFGEEDGRFFIVMEYLDGEDLRSLIAREGRQDPAKSVDIVARVAEALDHAHQSGAVHRDIKPANIFLTRGGDVKVTDFGIAQAANEAAVTVTGAFLGTLRYVSPEQAKGEPATPVSDIYSLGCVLFELLAGAPPFEGAPAALSMAHVSKPPPQISDFVKEIPEEINEVVARALEKDPADRFETAEAMAGALRATAGDPTLESAVAPVIDGAPTIAMSLGDKTLELEPEVQLQGQALPTIKPALSLFRPERSGGRRKRVSRFVLAVVAVAGAVLVAFALSGPLGGGDSGSLPDFVGEQIEEARLLAKDSNVNLQEVPTASEEPAGRVLRQEPEPGVSVQPGLTVRLFVSTGVPLIPVPDVVGKNIDDAKKLLEEAGFKTTVVGTAPGDRDGLVTAQDPPGGTPAAKGSTVGLTISEEQDERGSGKGRGGKD